MDVLTYIHMFGGVGDRAVICHVHTVPSRCGSHVGLPRSTSFTVLLPLLFHSYALKQFKPCKHGKLYVLQCLGNGLSPSVSVSFSSLPLSSLACPFFPSVCLFCSFVSSSKNQWPNYIRLRVGFLLCQPLCLMQIPGHWTT